MSETITGPAFFIGRGGDGGELISFGSGQPDLPPPPAAYRVLEHFRSFKYGLVQGELLLREALDERVRLGRDLHDGAIQRIYSCGMTLASGAGENVTAE